MKKFWKDLRYIGKEMLRMMNNPLTKWAVIIWFVLYMTYIFYIFDTIQCISYMCADSSISTGTDKIEVYKFKIKI